MLLLRFFHGGKIFTVFTGAGLQIVSIRFHACMLSKHIFHADVIPQSFTYEMFEYHAQSLDCKFTEPSVECLNALTALAIPPVRIT